MSWGDEVAATYRDVGTAESVTFTYNGTATTYADCQVTERQDARVNDHGQRKIVRFLKIHVPRISGATAPAERSAVAWGGENYTSGPASAIGPGVWRVEAT